MIRTWGLRFFILEFRDRMVDSYYDFRYGISTREAVKLRTIGIHRTDAVDSEPISYAAFYAALGRLPIEAPRTILVDYGAGKGRALCAAAALPFRRLIGVEFSQELAAAAVQNLSRMRRRRAQHFEVKRIDAALYELPDDVNLIYFYNPFSGATLSSVFDNIARSYSRRPRKIHFIFFNNDHFDKIAHRYPWIVKIYQTKFHPDVLCGLYETNL